LSLMAAAGFAMSVAALGGATKRQSIEEPRETSAPLEAALV